MPAGPGLFWVATATVAAQLAGTLANLATAPRLEYPAGALPEAGADPRWAAMPRVSLLIPARDEEDNLALLLPMLARLSPSPEILILDDHSSDATAELVRACQGPFRLLTGKPLPMGWLGKNWACAQLAEQAKGDILIFCDADVNVGPAAVAATVARMREGDLDALTCLPRQILGTWSERAVLPILLFMPLLGFLPLALIPRSTMPALSVGCGQWFAFTRSAYLAIGGHGSVRGEIVEDMALGRRVKEAGLKLGACLSTRYLATRMYTDFPSLWRGFSKNLSFLTGTGWIRPPLMFALFALLNILPWLLPLLGGRVWLVPCALWLASRLLCARAMREPATAWLWSPVGSLLIPCLAFASWRGHRNGSLQWKGRVLTAAMAGRGADK
jgi:chlorobactene glucosyltransferase